MNSGQQYEWPLANAGLPQIKILLIYLIVDSWLSEKLANILLFISKMRRYKIVNEKWV